jgi:N-acetylneuraminate lyase
MGYTMPKLLRGIFPALLTPLSDDGSEVNYAALRQLVEMQIASGVHGFFVCGGSGEGILLTANERRQILETVLDQVNGRTYIIAHVGAINTAQAQELAQHAASLKVDAIAAIPPIYFKVDGVALRDHYRLIAESAGDTPLWVYNIPSATGVEITAAVMADLLTIPTVRGIKYSSYNLYDMKRIIDLRSDITVHSGFDEVCVAGLTMGAHGAIGSTYNVLPATFVQLFKAASRGDWAGAQAIQGRANQAIQALLSVPLIGGMKAILSAWGIPCGSARRPQRPLTAEERSTILAAVEAAGIQALEPAAKAAVHS